MSDDDDYIETLTGFVARKDHMIDMIPKIIHIPYKGYLIVVTFMMKPYCISVNSSFRSIDGGSPPLYETPNMTGEGIRECMDVIDNYTDKLVYWSNRWTTGDAKKLKKLVKHPELLEPDEQVPYDHILRGRIVVDKMGPGMAEMIADDPSLLAKKK